MNDDDYAPLSIALTGSMVTAEGLLLFVCPLCSSVVVDTAQHTWAHNDPGT